MKITTVGELQICQSELLLSVGLPHGWFGTSLGNVQYREGNPFGDVPGEVSLEAVTQRRATACQALGLDAMRLVTTKGLLQTDLIQIVDATHGGLQAGPADGYITREADLPIATNSADCLTTIIYDPIAGALANVHSGGLGTHRGILPKAVQLMQDRLGADPRRMVVGIGPSLAGEHFTPTMEADNFTLETIGHSNPIAVALEDGRLGYDVRATAVRQLQEAGISAERIEVSDIDTYSSPAFYSWERDREGNAAFSMRRHLTLAALPLS
jgi:polyphenol oxidase